MVKHIVKGLYNISEFLLLKSLDVSELGFKIESFFNNNGEEEKVNPTIDRIDKAKWYDNSVN